MLALQVYQVAKHLTLTQHVYIVVPFFVANRFLEKIPEADRAVILETGRAVPVNMASICAEAEKAGLVTLAKDGIKIQELANRDAFANLVKGVPAEFADALGGTEFLQLMKDAH
jgi:TRAP-type C4-dicarboxylate transport system substrate-binding protein